MTIMVILGGYDLRMVIISMSYSYLADAIVD